MRAKDRGTRTFSEQKAAHSGALASFHVLSDRNAEASARMVDQGVPGVSAVSHGGR